GEFHHTEWGEQEGGGKILAEQRRRQIAGRDVLEHPRPDLPAGECLPVRHDSAPRTRSPGDVGEGLLGQGFARSGLKLRGISGNPRTGPTDPCAEKVSLRLAADAAPATACWVSHPCSLGSFCSRS